MSQNSKLDSLTTTNVLSDNSCDDAKIQDPGTHSIKMIIKEMEIRESLERKVKVLKRPRVDHSEDSPMKSCTSDLEDLLLIKLWQRKHKPLALKCAVSILNYKSMRKFEEEHKLTHSFSTKRQHSFDHDQITLIQSKYPRVDAYNFKDSLVSMDTLAH